MKFDTVFLTILFIVLFFVIFTIGFFITKYICRTHAIKKCKKENNYTEDCINKYMADDCYFSKKNRIYRIVHIIISIVATFIFVVFVYHIASSDVGGVVDYGALFNGFLKLIS